MNNRLKFGITPAIRETLKRNGHWRWRNVNVRKKSFDEFLKLINAGGYGHLSIAEREALAISCCMTHPDHKTKHRMIPHFIWYALAAIVLILAFAIASHAQGKSQISVIQIQDSTGTIIKTFVAPFKIKCDTNLTCSVVGSTLTMQSAAGGGGGSGTVTSVSGLSPLFTVANPSTTPTFSLSSAAANTVLGNNTGSPAAPAYFGFIPPITKAAVASNWLRSFDSTTGLFTASQPAYSDVSGTPQLAITKAAVASNWLRSYDSTTGLFTASQPAFTDVSGSVASTQMPALTGDTTSSAGATVTTTGKVNGVSYGSSPATDTIPVITASVTETYTAVPNCADTAGNHLNYATASHTFSCGTTNNSDTNLGCITIGSAAATIGPLTIAANKQLRIPVYISSYAGGGGTALMTFNGAGGTAYRFRWLTSAAAATTFTAGTSNPPTVSTSGIRLGPDNTTLSRNVIVYVTNDSANTEKLVLMEQAIGTGSAGTQTALTFGNGAWVSGSSTSITSVTLTAGVNFGAGSGFCVFGSNF